MVVMVQLVEEYGIVGCFVEFEVSQNFGSQNDSGNSPNGMEVD